MRVGTQNGTGWPSGLFRALCVTAVIVCGMTVVYWRVIAHYGETPSLGLLDFWRYHTPNAFFLDCCVHQGEFPLWNPLVMCGEPFAANPQTGVFYPFNLARSLLTAWPTPLRTHTGLMALIGLHTLGAALAMYAYGRACGLSRMRASA